MRNVWSSYGVRVVLGASALLLTPYLFRSLGAAGFGTWSVMFGLVAMSGLVDLGVSAGIGRTVASLRAQQRPADVRRALGAAVAVTIAFGALIATAFVAVALVAPGLAAAGQGDAFAIGMAVLAAATVLRFPAVAYGGALIGYQRYDLVNAARALEAVAFAVGAIVALEAGAGLRGLAAAHATALLASGAFLALALKRTDPLLSLRPRADRHAGRVVAGFSLWVLLLDGMRFVGQSMDTVVIAALRGAASASPFAAAVKLQTALQTLSLPFVYLLMPMVADLWARGRRDEVARRLKLGCRVALQVTLPVALGIALFAGDIVELWLGDEAPAVTATIVVILMAAQTIGLAIAPAEQILIGIGRARTAGRLALAEGLCNIAISIALVARYGPVGAAIGTLVATFALAPLRLPLACRAIGYSTGACVRASVVPAVLASLPAAAAMIGAFVLLPPGAARVGAGLFLGAVLALAAAAAQMTLSRAAPAVRQLLRDDRRAVTA